MLTLLEDSGVAWTLIAITYVWVVMMIAYCYEIYRDHKNGK